ncbi:MAG: exo-alpha-sialidase [Clostridia bacterium]|nr:exo-alpha-sialidase [Clostridia bacterium]
MFSYINKMEKTLSENDRKMLSDIYAPTVVATPDADPYYNLCITRDGAIRAYGHYMKKHVFDTDCRACYIESTDCGLSWKRYLVDDKNAMGASTYVPYLDKYVKLKNTQDGTFALIGHSPDDAEPEMYKIADPGKFREFRLPYVLSLQNRIICIVHENRLDEHPTCFYNAVLSSVDGKEWNITHLPAAPYAEKKWPHKGVRWQQNNRESTVTELSDGTLLLISRTSTDFHYTCTSTDGGLTWTHPEKSIFHSTGTMPVLKKLSDGRIMFFWCNTKLLPEVHDADGIWEDFFTNRDANHCAISEDDGKTWRGYREMVLNPIRCAADFRSNGGPECDRDKSVHQFEALQLPMNKILVVCGQHYSCRRIIIFDINWLYETSRHEDFIHGLANLSTQSYVKSISGGFPGQTPETALSYVGHCACNRVSGALLLPSPENDKHEVLHIASSADTRLLNPLCGAVWNFPVIKKGKLVLTAHLPENGKGLRISLLDHWMNPCDNTVEYYADFSIHLRPDMHPENELFTDFVFEFDCERNTVTLTAGDYLRIEKTLSGAHPNGLCYLHMQSANESDYVGAMVKAIDVTAI